MDDSDLLIPLCINVLTFLLRFSNVWAAFSGEITLERARKWRLEREAGELSKDNILSSQEGKYRYKIDSVFVVKFIWWIILILQEDKCKNNDNACRDKAFSKRYINPFH